MRNLAFDFGVMFIVKRFIGHGNFPYEDKIVLKDKELKTLDNKQRDP